VLKLPMRALLALLGLHTQLGPGIGIGLSFKFRLTSRAAQEVVRSFVSNDDMRAVVVHVLAAYWIR